MGLRTEKEKWEMVMAGDRDKEWHRRRDGIVLFLGSSSHGEGPESRGRSTGKEQFPHPGYVCR